MPKAVGARSGRGHWAKLAHGHSGTTKPTLPKLEKVPVIYRSPVAHKPPNKSDDKDPEFAAITEMFSSGALNPPELEPDFRLPALVRQTASLLRSRARKDERGVLLPREPGGIDVKVTDGMLARALQIIAQAVTVLERLGHGVEISEQGRTVAVIDGERVCFGIEEPVRRIVTRKPRVPNPTDRWDYDQIVRFEPTGKLALVIHSGMWGQREQRTRWADGKVQRVERLLGEFVAGLMRTAILERRQEEERKQREAERQRREREAVQLRQQIQQEEKKLSQLNRWVDEWDRAEKLRRFVTVYARESASWPAEKQDQYKSWIEWASAQANRLDPFVVEKPTSVLDRKHELTSW